MAGRRNRPVLPPLQSISKFVKRCRHPKHHASRCGVLHCLGDRSDFFGAGTQLIRPALRRLSL